MGLKVPWTFYDPQTADTYTFTVNPNTGGTPTRKKNITQVKTTAWDGNRILFEGTEEPQQFTWSGVLLTKEQLDAFIRWFDKRTQVLLTDDLGREFYIYITNFEPKRERAAHNPWKFSYTASAMALDWVIGATPSLDGFSRVGDSFPVSTLVTEIAAPGSAPAPPDVPPPPSGGGDGSGPGPGGGGGGGGTGGGTGGGGGDTGGGGTGTGGGGTGGGGGGTTPPPAGFRLYADSSLWNTVKSSAGPFATGADSMLSSRNYGINNGDFCHPFFVAVSSDPTWTVNSGAGWGKPARTVSIHAPSGFHGTNGSDHVATVLDIDGTLWDMYGVSVNAGTLTINCDFLVDSDGVNGSGFGDQTTFASVGTTAIGQAQASGTILASDIAAGAISHALCMAFAYSDQGGVGTAGQPSVPPAVANDVGGGPGPMVEGGLMIATGIEPSGLNAMEHQLWIACSTYGVFCTDKLDGDPMFFGDGSVVVDTAFTGAGLTAIGRKLRLVDNF